MTDPPCATVGHIAARVGGERARSLARPVERITCRVARDGTVDRTIGRVAAASAPSRRSGIADAGIVPTLTSVERPSSAELASRPPPESVPLSIETSGPAIGPLRRPRRPPSHPLPRLRQNPNLRPHPKRPRIQKRRRHPLSQRKPFDPPTPVAPPTPAAPALPPVPPTVDPGRSRSATLAAAPPLPPIPCRHPIPFEGRAFVSSPPQPTIDAHPTARAKNREFEKMWSNATHENLRGGRSTNGACPDLNLVQQLAPWREDLRCGGLERMTDARATGTLSNFSIPADHASPAVPTR